MPRSESRVSHSPKAPLLTSQGHAGPSHKKKTHICPTCDRAFSTMGHLARHSRVHTGEKNHKCPFPGCETRCSRQDNLQQHYRIHLAPGSRKTSKSGLLRRKRESIGIHNDSSPASGPSSIPLSRDLTPPPDSPPPLEQATLSAFFQKHRNSVSPILGSPYPYTQSPQLPLSAPPLLSQSDQYLQSPNQAAGEDNPGHHVGNTHYSQPAPSPDPPSISPSRASPEIPSPYPTRYQYSYELPEVAAGRQYLEDKHPAPSSSMHSRPMSHMAPIIYGSPQISQQYLDPSNSPSPTSSSSSSISAYAYEPLQCARKGAVSNDSSAIHRPSESLNRYTSPPPSLTSIPGYHEDHRFRMPRTFSANYDLRVYGERYGGSRYIEDRPSGYHSDHTTTYRTQLLGTVSDGYGYPDSLTIEHNGQWRPQTGMRPRAVAMVQ